jgi:hypothetical protein
VDEADETPSDAASRLWANTAFGVAGPIAIALVVGLGLAATSTPAPNEEFYAYVLYIATAVYIAGLIWDLLIALLNSAANRQRSTARNYSSCLLGLLPVGGLVVALSAVADGDGWIFDWRLVLVAVLVLNVGEFLLFSWISSARPPASPA